MTLPTCPCGKLIDSGPTCPSCAPAYRAGREDVIAFIDSYPFWIGTNAKKEIIDAIRKGAEK